MPDSFVTYVSPVIYACLATCYIYLFASKSNVNPIIKVLAKILPHLTMVCTIMYMFATTEEPFPVISPYYLLKLNSTLHMYLFIMMADVLFSFKTTFVYGMMYSCAAQYMMAYMLSEGYAMFVNVLNTEKVSLGVYTSLMLYLYLYVSRRLTLMTVIPVFIYCALFTASIWSASLHVQRLVTPCTIGITVGTTLLLAVNAMFARSNWPGKHYDERQRRSTLNQNEANMMVVYYIAMFLIVYCTIQAENEPAFYMERSYEKY